MAFGCVSGSVVVSRLRSELERTRACLFLLPPHAHAYTRAHTIAKLLKSFAYLFSGVVLSFTAVEELELKETTMMKRLWGGIMPAFSRASTAAMIGAIETYSNAADGFVFALGGDQRLRVWSVSKRAILGARDVAPDAADAAGPLVGRMQMRLLMDARFPAEARILVHFPGVRASVFLTYVLSLGSSTVELGLESVRDCGEQAALQSVAVSRTHIWTMWAADAPLVVRSAPVRDAGDGQATVWDEAVPLPEPVLPDEEVLQLTDDVQVQQPSP